MGDWTRSAQQGNSGRVLYSLTQSRNPIVNVIVRLDGKDQDNLAGTDLRKVAGSYVQLPIVRGTYALTVLAVDSLGCMGAADRPMSITVK